MSTADIWRERIREALERVDPSMSSPEAVELLLGTAARESRLGKFGNSVAKHGIGPFQIIKSTEKDIWENYLRYKPELRKRIIEATGETGPNPRALIDNFDYATAMARTVYKRTPEPLPAADDIQGQARYWKKYYNTAAGKGTVSGYMKTAPGHQSGGDTYTSGVYQVRRGDTLSEIAKKTMGSALAYKELFAANRDVLDSPHSIYPGQKLRIPGKSDYTEEDYEAETENYGAEEEYPDRPNPKPDFDSGRRGDPLSPEENYPDRPKPTFTKIQGGHQYIPHLTDTWKSAEADQFERAAKVFEPTLTEMAAEFGVAAASQGLIGMALKLFGRAPVVTAAKQAIFGRPAFGPRHAMAPKAGRISGTRMASPPKAGRIPTKKVARQRPMKSAEPKPEKWVRPRPLNLPYPRPPRPQTDAELLRKAMEFNKLRNNPTPPTPGNPELLRILYEQAISRGGKRMPGPRTGPGKMIDIGSTKNMSVQDILDLLE